MDDWLFYFVLAAVFSVCIYALLCDLFPVLITGGTTWNF